MSRSGYDENYDPGWSNAVELYRANVDRAFKGKRGQKFLRELLAALDAMPVKRLIAHDTVREGEFCALGVVCAQRGLKMEISEFDNAEWLAHTLKIARPLAAEIVHVNDEYIRTVFRMHWKTIMPTPEERWTYMRAWVAEQINLGGTNG